MHTRGAAAGRDETCAREQLRVGVGCPQSTVMAQGVALHEEQLVMMAQRPAPTGLTRWRGCFLPSPARHMNRRRYHVYVRTWRCWRCSCEAGGRGGGSRGSGGGLAATQAAGGASRALRRGARRHELLEHVHPRYESWIGDRGPDRRRALERRLRRGCIQRHKEQKQQGLLHAANRESAQCHLRTYVGAISELRQQRWR